GAELGALPWLAWSREQGHLPEARWLEQVVPGAKVALHAADFVALFEAARAGMGVFLVPGPMARLEGLAILDGAPPLGPRGALWMVAHRALRAVGRVDCVWRWLIEHFARLKQQTWAAEHT
ncbi:MAG: LysR substrate-binding domain-containing protein, partial [Myxococcota bacterium]